MNKKLVTRMVGAILLIEAAAMLPSFLIALCYGEGDALPLLLSILAAAAVGLPMRVLPNPSDTNMRAKEGFLVVSLAWIGMSFFGALPFVMGGMIPNLVDAIFESVSGFTTTGATIMTVVDGQPHGLMFWRSFTHWIGGMGVLVLTLALLPKLTGRTAHLMRAESPGPSLSKIAPKMGDTAKILYLVYAALTLLMFIALLIAGMNPYDAALHALGTAGTGGFSNYGASVAAFHSPAIEIVITVFMFMFGTNLALYYQLLQGKWRDILHNEELRWFAAINGFAIVFITLALLPVYGTVGESLRYAAFQVASITSTTGFATADFNLWPIAVRMLIFILMFFGSCVGSTAGGMKLQRVALLCKQCVREVRRTFQPRKVQTIRFEGRGVEEGMLHQIAIFFCVYLGLILIGAFLISLEGKFDVETNLTAALTCVSNVGPGLGAVGPAGSFAGYGPFAKLVLSVLMLAGRLELFPMLVLLNPSIWRKS